MNMLDGFASLAARYDGFILDLWGVIHDGVTPYPGAAECMIRLREAGKGVILLSNAPRRASAAARAMQHMGLPASLYDGIVTSGEATHTMLRDRTDPWFAGLGRRCWHLGPERDLNLYEGLDIELVARPEQAEFCVNTGPDDHRNPTSLDPFEADLAEARANRLKMICANPDLEVIRGGQRIICAGLLAQRYEELGGEVFSLGKPDPAIYGPILAQLDLPKPRILAVGDALRTDIAGARAIGVDSCWVLGGIHGEQDDPGAAAREAGLAPVAMIRSFSW